MTARPTPKWREAVGFGHFLVDELARIMDHTILKAQATPAEVETLCDEAARYGFGAVCVNSAYVPLAVSALKDRPATTGAVRVCAVVGFPLGAMATEVKAYEAAWAVGRGAGEVDMVISVGRLKGGDGAAVEEDIRGVVAAARQASERCGGKTGLPLVKVIVETGYLTDGEKVEACRRAVSGGADFVKTSTGFGNGGATTADVTLMRRAVGEELGVKASGGIRDLETALAMIAAGADRLGLSAGVAVVQEARALRAGFDGPAGG